MKKTNLALNGREIKKSLFISLVLAIFMVNLLSLSTAYAESRIEVEKIYSGNLEHGVVRAYDNGTLIWEFVTPESPRTELQGISDVYQNSGNAYIAAANTLFALDADTGNNIWSVYNAGASSDITFDKYGNIYICGYYGPNLLVVDKNGNELYREDSDPNYYWVYDLEINGNTLNMYYESDMGGVRTVDISRFAQKAISVELNGTEVAFDQPPVMINDRVMVPIRAIFEALGYTVEWNQDTQTAVATKSNNTISVQMNNSNINYILNGSSGTYYCDVLPQMVSDRILVPVRAVSESAGCEVNWDEKENTVHIKS